MKALNPLDPLNPRKVLTLSAILALSVCLLTPASAFAKNEFEDAFKGELGRIAAHHATYGGKRLLGAILFGSGHHASGHGHGGHHGHSAPRHHYEDRGHGYGHRGHHSPPRYRHYEHHDRRYDRGGRHGGHRHGRHCGH